MAAAAAPAAAAPVAPPAKTFTHLKLRCSEAEQEAIDALRPRVASSLHQASDLWRSDYMLLRFIRARKMNLDAAEAFYRDVIQWRLDVGADRMLTEYKEPEVMRLYFPGGIHGVDHDGNAVLIERTGNMDVKGFTESIGVDDFLRWIIFYHERQEAHILAVSEAAGEWKVGLTVIADLANASVRHMAPSVISAAQKRTRLEEDHYPETAKKCFIVRAPRIFSAIYNLVKPMLDEGTREKIVVLSGDYIDELKKFIPIDQIPKYLQGNCACEGDPDCRSKVNVGGTVPASLRAGLPASSEVIDVKSGQSDVSHLPVESGTKVSWNFKLTSSDVNFFGFYTPPHVDLSAVNMAKLAEPPGGAHVVVKPKRVPEGTGEFIATAEGHFTLVWDNTSSWFSGRTVMKTVDLVEAAREPTPSSSPPSDAAPAAGAGTDTTA